MTRPCSQFLDATHFYLSDRENFLLDSRTCKIAQVFTLSKACISFRACLDQQQHFVREKKDLNFQLIKCKFQAQSFCYKGLLEPLHCRQQQTSNFQFLFLLLCKFNRRFCFFIYFFQQRYYLERSLVFLLTPLSPCTMSSAPAR